MSRLFAVFVLCLTAVSAWAEKAVVLGKDELAVYGSPSGRGLLARVPPRAEVEVLESQGRAAKVRFRGTVGWVKRSRLEIAEAPKPAPAPRVDAPRPPESAAPTAAPVAGAGVTAAPAAIPPAESPSASVPTAASPPVPPVAPAPAGGYLSKFDKEEAAPRAEVGPSLFTAVSALLFVLALVAGAVYLIKRFAGRRVAGGSKAKGIQVLATRPLGPRQALLLIEVGGVPLLLAQGDGMVNLIAEIRDPDAVERLNDLYGFRDTPFEAELRDRLDLESQEPQRRRTPETARTPSPDPGPVPEEKGLSPEERLAALRRRPKPGGEP